MRRLHDEYRYTTVYVTHDQSEAMTTADVIAVMNLGKIEQAGSPEEIYERPRSEFVARFIGMSNVVQRQGARRRPASRSPASRCAAPATPLQAGADAAVSIRQHDIELSAKRAGGQGERRAGHGGAAGLSRHRAATIWSRSRTARSCAWSRRRPRASRRARRCGCICRRSAAAR